MYKTIKNIHSYTNIDGLIPGVRGQRAFPTRHFKNSDPFLMLDHIGPQKVGKDFFLDGSGHDHPHRGFETLTFLFEGRMEHRDSLGNQASLVSGSVQRMNAGSGIIHGGDMAADPDTERFHEVQLWINNPMAEKMSKPGIHNVSSSEFPTVESGAITLRVVSGNLHGFNGPLETKAATQIGHLLANGNGQMELDDFAEGHHLMIYVLEGEVMINDSALTSFQLAEFSDTGDAVRIQTNAYCQLLLLAGQPLKEPLAFGGPFVMNTQEEIVQAQTDFQNGKFGVIA